jgi:hypothetical protein
MELMVMTSFDKLFTIGKWLDNYLCLRWCCCDDAVFVEQVGFSVYA